ncbi:helix-turn-helix domain-containing protein [Actinoplanes sp. G11-F43]|uniref:helix-turn-helix domain-containing protein n=1 Tax=Actinoplanes sp. G11-F43 TaxID=3424130 RepID=UPI003D3502F4
MPDAPSADARLLSVKELAARLNLSDKTVYVMARAGEIPAIRRQDKPRAPWRFDLAEVLAALRHRNGRP